MRTGQAPPRTTLPATLADADAMLPKGSGARALLAAIRQVCDGKRLLPPISAAVIDEGCAELLEPDRALVAMLLAGASESSRSQADQRGRQARWTTRVIVCRMT